MIIHFDARFARWAAVCDSLIAFRRTRVDHSAYCYIRAPDGMRAAIARLCTHLDLDDAYSFYDEASPDGEEITWIDLATPWLPREER